MDGGSTREAVINILFSFSDFFSKKKEAEKKKRIAKDIIMTNFHDLGNCICENICLSICTNVQPQLSITASATHTFR